MMRSLLTSCAIVIAAVLTANGPAMAAPPSQPIGDMANRMTGRVADCIIKRDPKLMVAWLGTLPGSPAEKAVVQPREGMFSACFGSWLAVLGGWQPKYDYPAMRAAIIRALIENRIVTLPLSPPPGLGEPRWFRPEVANDSASASSLVANDMGFCLARTDWPAVRGAVL